jgi:DNA-binding response OmpR family regulator
MSPPEQLICVGELHLDPAARRASLAGRELELSRREWLLLSTLAAERAACLREPSSDRSTGLTATRRSDSLTAPRYGCAGS